MSLARRQLVLARFLDDPEFEAELRADPRGCAQRHELEFAYVRWIATLEPRRVEAFRRGQRAKSARREGRE